MRKMVQFVFTVHHWEQSGYAAASLSSFIRAFIVTCRVVVVQKVPFFSSSSYCQTGSLFLKRRLSSVPFEIGRHLNLVLALP